MDSGYHVSQNDSSEVMFGRKNGLFGVCHLLLPAVTVSDPPCEYTVRLTTGTEYGAGSDDNIMIQIRENGKWHSLDNYGVDDFERYHTDKFTFEDDCVDKHQQTTVGNAGHGRFFGCFSDTWLVTHVILFRVDGKWLRDWYTHKWLYCHDTLKLSMK